MSYAIFSNGQPLLTVLTYLAAPLQHVSQRQEGYHDVGTLQFVIPELQEDGARGGHYVLVGQHDPFGISCRSAGVAYGSEVGGLRGLKKRKIFSLKCLLVKFVVCTHYFRMVLLGAERLHVRVLDDFDAHILRPLLGRDPDVFDHYQLLQTSGGFLHQHIALDVILAYHYGYFSYKTKAIYYPIVLKSVRPAYFKINSIPIHIV